MRIMADIWRDKLKDAYNRRNRYNKFNIAQSENVLRQSDKMLVEGYIFLLRRSENVF